MTAKVDTLPGVSGPIEGLDVDALRQAIQDEYALVAAEPERDFHFHTGRRLARSSATTQEWLGGVPGRRSLRSPAPGIRSVWAG